MRSCRVCQRHTTSSDNEEIQCTLSINTIDRDSIENGCHAFLTSRLPAYDPEEFTMTPIDFEATERFLK